MDPLAYIHGFGNLIPGLERELEGKKVGDKSHVVVKPEEAYGVRHDELVQEVPLASFDDASHVQEGAQFQMHTPEGARIATVTKVSGDKVTIDLNHPLAGETLHFDVAIENIREATETELEHGHVHGPGGHHH